MIYFVDEPLSNGSRVLPISICVCGSASEAASVICDHVAWPSALYTNAGQLASQCHFQEVQDVFTHCSLHLLKRHALQTHHGYAIVFIINSINTIWRPLCPICKHMATLRWGGDRVYLKSQQSRKRLNFLNGVIRNEQEYCGNLCYTTNLNFMVDAVSLSPHS